MPEVLSAEPTPKTAAEEDQRVFSGYGLASTVLALIAVTAAALAVLIWSGHRSDVAELGYQSRVLRAAADWTGVLVNMNKDTVDASMQKLHDGTVGQLNTDFESAVDPYRQVVQRLQSRTTGQVDSVAVEAIHHNPQGSSGAPPAPKPDPQPGLGSYASRTDTVLVVATSVSENVGAKPQTVRWNLRLDVSDVDGKLLISRLESIR